MPAPNQVPIEYPLLGEPPVVEFVNTFYVDPSGSFDFLETVDRARGWFTALEPPILLNVERLDETALHDVIELRAAIRTVTATNDLASVSPSLATLQSAANRSPAHIELSCTDSGELNVHRVHDLSGPDGTLAFLAHAAIDIAAGNGPGRLLICDRPACNMRYLQHHRRRRYCNPACANADRQARFQQRHRN